MSVDLTGARTVSVSLERGRVNVNKCETDYIRSGESLVMFEAQNLDLV